MIDSAKDSVEESPRPETNPVNLDDPADQQLTASYQFNIEERGICIDLSIAILPLLSDALVNKECQPRSEFVVANPNQGLIFLILDSDVGFLKERSSVRKEFQKISCKKNPYL